MTETENLEQSLVAYHGGSLLPSTCERLAASMQRYQISGPELADNRRLLEEERSRDEQRLKKSLDQAKAEYRKNNGALRRLLYWVGRGCKSYVPAVPEAKPSPEQELLENLVNLQQAVDRGYQLLIDLPRIVEQMNRDYASLEARERELVGQMARTRGLSRNLPETVAAYEKAKTNLENYANSNNADRMTLDDFFVVGDKAPSLESAEVRTVLIDYINQAITNLQSNSLNSDSLLKLDEEELAQLREDKALLEQQYRGLQESWSPALQALHKLKSGYDRVKRFAPSARLAIGMNNLREQTVNLIASSEQVMARAVTAMEQSKVRAEAAEEIEAVIRGSR